MPTIEETHIATVTANNDDEQRGRIRVACISLMGDEETELPMWIEPSFDWGFFYVPDIGETVEIVSIASSDDDESFMQSSIDDIDLKWRGTRYYTDLEPENENTAPTPIHPEFKTSYGKRRGFATPHGHVIMFDDTEGSQSLQISCCKDKYDGETFEPENYSRLEFEPDGSFKVSLLNKHTIHFQAEGNKLVVGIDEGQSLEVNGKDGDTVTTLGDGSVSAVIAEELKTFWDTVAKIYIDTHLHNTSMGPSSPPTTQIQAYDDAITSTKLKFPSN